MISLLNPPPFIRAPVFRLRGITGFVTVFPDRGDARTQVFARYLHVRRVAAVSILLAERWGLDGAHCATLAWMHDLNRWPFARNIEKGNFDQVGNLHRFLRSLQISETIAREAGAVARKDPSPPTKAAEAVLIADIVAGFFEDILLSITGLHLDPGAVPSSVNDMLGMELREAETLHRLANMHRSLHIDGDVRGYVRLFDEYFIALVQRFVQNLGLSRSGCFGNSQFQAVRSHVRYVFLPEVLFPLSSELVCKAPLIRELFGEPLLRHISDHERLLTAWTEQQAVVAAVRGGWLSRSDIDLLAPDLDALKRAKPDRVFRVAAGS
jgi:hypothetical protein